MLTRFAPSPTGLLHIGNARTALICWFLTVKSGGKMLLRIDDTDIERSRAIFTEKIKENLLWLGISWEGEVSQSSRLNSYDKIFELLVKKGVIYPCYETKEDLEIRRELLLKSGKPPIYKRCNALSKSSNSAPPAFRFDLGYGKVSWNDGIRGNIEFDFGSLSDPIIKRADGTYTYMFPSVVDDVEFNITDIVRGEDHITNTAVQIKIFEVLNAKIPKFYHVSLVYAGDSKISKREGGLDLDSVIEKGFESIAVSSYLLSVGTATRFYADSINHLVDMFDINVYSSAPARFDYEELHVLNGSLIKKMQFSDVIDRLKAIGVYGDERFWNIVRKNISMFSEVLEWWSICREKVVPVIEDEGLASVLAELLQKEEWDDQTWDKWVVTAKQRTKLSGAALFHPIRRAITGKSNGPQLKELFYLIGKERVISRLLGIES